MGDVAIYDICEAVRSVIGSAPLIVRGESTTDFSAINQDLPKVVTYAQDGESSRQTFGRGTTAAPMRFNSLSIYADVWVAPLNWFGQEMALTMQVLDNVVRVLETENGPVYFGLDGIKAFIGYSWSFILPTQGEGTALKQYFGLRFVLDLEVF